MKLALSSTSDTARALAANWPKGALLSVALVLSLIFWLVVWYLDTVQSMVAIWVRSDTFAHGFLIVPISVWMMWQRRNDLASLQSRPNLLILPILALAGFGWLLGHLAGAGVVQQYCLVLMIPLLVWAVMGNEVVRTLTFPLLYLLFAVPFGEFLEPLLMEYTADFTVFALRATGIPVYREGQFFMIPSGNWSVVEACSGLRYLIASLTLGLLYAYLTYTSYYRRALFVLASFVVPIVANWLRAYMIVMIGHLSSMKYAVGIDHLIYGWLFFGVVMLLLFWIGSFWREDLVSAQAEQHSRSPADRRESSSAMAVAVAVCAAVLVVAWPVVASRLDGKGPFPSPVLVVPQGGAGWQPMAGPITEWIPRIVGPRAQLNQAYAGSTGRAGIYVGYYRNQQEGTQLISTQNALVTTDNSEWSKVREVRRTLVFGDETIPAIEADLRGRATRLLTWRWYWVDGEFTVNPYWAKLLQAKSALSGRGDKGAVVILYTDLGIEREKAATRLQGFAGAMLPGIKASLQNAR